MVREGDRWLYIYHDLTGGETVSGSVSRLMEYRVRANRNHSVRLSLIVPVLNEEGQIDRFLDSFAELESKEVELIVVDGGSRDQTKKRANAGANRVLVSPPGRALQMNHGARASVGEYLLFLHVDTRLPTDAGRVFDSIVNRRVSWGRFDVRLTGKGVMFRLIERMMNWRSRFTGIATGDQAIFVRRNLFFDIGGYPEIGLMEDVALCKLLKKKAGAPECLRDRVETSSRRWESRGIVRTVVYMWALRFLYFLGVDPRHLARLYYPYSY